MAEKFNKNEEQFGKIVREFVHHKGLGGEEAHPIVDAWEAGFMSPQMLETLTNASGKTSKEIKGVDALDLGPGIHSMYGENVTGLPNNAYFHMLDISTFNKYKNILAYRTSTNEIYSKMLDGNGNPGMGINMWGKITKEYELYRGSFEANQKGVLTLPIDVTVFDELKILYIVGSNDFDTTVSPNGLKGGRTIVGTNMINNKTSVQTIEVDIKLDPNDFKKLTVTDFRGITVGSNFASDTTKDNSLQIYKIIGRR